MQPQPGTTRQQDMPAFAGDDELERLARRLVATVAACGEEGERERMFTAAAILGFFRHLDRTDTYYRRRFMVPGMEDMRADCRRCAHGRACAADDLLTELLDGLRLSLDAA